MKIEKKVSFEMAMFSMLSVPFIIALNGWALSVVWAWFIIPLGAPAIGAAHAMGIAVLARMLGTSSDADSEGKELAVLVITGILKPFVSLGVAWLFHSLM